MTIVPHRRDDPGETFLTNPEIAALCDALRAGPGTVSFEEDAVAFASWAQDVRIRNELLELVLAGMLLVHRQSDGEWAVRLTPAALMVCNADEGGHN